MPRHEVLPEQHRDGGPSDGAPLAVVRAPAPFTVALEDVEEGAGVEVVPSEQEEEGYEDDEGGAVAAEGDRAAGVVEVTDARPRNTISATTTSATKRGIRFDHLLFGAEAEAPKPS